MASLLSAVKGVREYLTPVRVISGFLDKGVLTPDEFVAAGDQLVFKCPTWSWEAGEPSKAKPYLPPNKQFLVTRKVPCHRRITSLENDYLGDNEIEGLEEGTGETWIEPNVVTEAQRGGSAGLDVAELELASSMTGGILLPELEMTGNATAEVTQGFGAIELLDDHFQTAARAAAAPAPAAASSAVATTEATTAAAAETDAAGDGAESRAAAGPASGGADAGGLKVVRTGDAYLDLDTFVQDNVLEPDQATLHHTAAYMTAEEPEDVIVRTRSYDLSITYDKYYQTPRIWLLGYDELQQGLNGEQMFEDVMQDYARQTVTIEPHPHLETYHASVHPCRHAAVMKRIVENLTRGGKEARVDQYLFIFLKFVQSVIPTVNYDHTMDVDT